MRHYAHIVAGVVVETLATEASISSLFHPAMTWLEIPPGSEAAPGWHWDGGQFSPPFLSATPIAHSVPNVAAELVTLQLRLNALATIVAGQ